MKGSLRFPRQIVGNCAEHWVLGSCTLQEPRPPLLCPARTEQEEWLIVQIAARQTQSWIMLNWCHTKWHAHSQDKPVCGRQPLACRLHLVPPLILLPNGSKMAYKYSCFDLHFTSSFDIFIDHVVYSNHNPNCLLWFLKRRTFTEFQISYPFCFLIWGLAWPNIKFPNFYASLLQDSLWHKKHGYNSNFLNLLTWCTSRMLFGCCLLHI